MIHHIDYNNYFENLAASHVDIRHSEREKHFFRASLEDVYAGIGNNLIRYPALMLLPLEIRNIGNADNQQEKFFGGFMILDALRNPEDSVRRELILKETRIIAEDIIQIMMVHQNNCTPPFDETFNEFDHTDIKKREWGPVWDNCFGWSYEFPILAPYTHNYNPEKWL